MNNELRNEVIKFLNAHLADVRGLLDEMVTAHNEAFKCFAQAVAQIDSGKFTKALQDSINAAPIDATSHAYRARLLADMLPPPRPRP